MGHHDLRFPRFRKAVLRNFSLYTAESEIAVKFDDGVFCLAGANGLGKSTFLAAVNFGITGIVPDPERTFLSVEEHYRYSVEFSKRFFTGRITEKDRDAAEIHVEFEIGEHTYRLTRGLFEPQELRELEITSSGTRPKSIVHSDLDANERLKFFQDQLTKDVGLDAFEQFVFLQHFLMTFDERRHLLFWDEKVLEQALFLTFGLDLSEARKADNLRRDAERADSLARNANWQATELRKKIEDIQRRTKKKESSKVEKLEDLVEEHKELTAEVERQEKIVARLRADHEDASLKFAELSAKHETLRAEYTEEFSQHIKGHASLGRHPLVVLSIKDERCGFCGSEGPAVAKEVGIRAKSKECMLCGTSLNHEALTAKKLNRLKELDKALSRVKSDLENATGKMRRVSDEFRVAIELEDKLQKDLDRFESKNKAILRDLGRDRTDSEPLEELIRSYKLQMDESLKKKATHYRTRNEKRQELQKLQKKLEKHYAQAEKKFLPLFSDLAFSFLGLDLDVRLDTKVGVKLVLEIRGQTRRDFHQLSESQRFFIDIALRMALAQFASDPKAKACLLIDTPEGSLDIAYESRAGNMFSRFVKTGHQLIMTANINGSRVLLSMAEECGEARMQLCRMTTWTDLSEVQEAEESLFAEAYDKIEEALTGT